MTAEDRAKEILKEEAQFSSEQVQAAKKYLRFWEMEKYHLWGMLVLAGSWIICICLAIKTKEMVYFIILSAFLLLWTTAGIVMFKVRQRCEQIMFPPKVKRPI